MTTTEIGREATEMVRKVAEAIADAFMEDFAEAPGLYCAMAEAAIKAMRNPTPAMIAAGLNERDVNGTGARGLPLVFARMIDAALDSRTGADQAGEGRP